MTVLVLHGKLGRRCAIPISLYDDVTAWLQRPKWVAMDHGCCMGVPLL